TRAPRRPGRDAAAGRAFVEGYAHDKFPRWLFRGHHGSLARRGQRLVEVVDDVVDVLDADAQPDHLGLDAGLELLVRRPLPMGGGSRVAGERFRVAHVDQALDQLERVVEAFARVEAAAHPEGEQRTRAPVQILARQRVIRTVAEAGIIYPGDARVVAQKRGYLGGVLDVAFHPQRDGLDALEQKECTQWRERPAGGGPLKTAAPTAARAAPP